jgi:hypothetical protein
MRISFKFLSIIILLTSCSGLPSESEAKDALETKIKNESKGQIELIEFTKTNSQENEIMGQKMFKLMYNAKVKFKSSVWIYTNKTPYGDYFPSYKTYNKQPEIIPSLSMVMSKSNKNQVVPFNGTFTYLETEKGWILK